MAVKAPKPPRTPKGEPPAKKEVRGNISKPEPERTVTINFRGTERVKRDLKIMAATHGITQSALIIEAIKDWSERHS